MHFRTGNLLCTIITILILTALPLHAQVFNGSYGIFNQSDLVTFCSQYTSTTGYLNIQYVVDLSPLQNFTSANGFYISYSYMTDLHGLGSLVNTGSSFEIQSCPLLQSLDGLNSLQQVNQFVLVDLPSLVHAVGPAALTTVHSLRLDGFSNLLSISGFAALNSLKGLVVRNCPLLTDVSGFADLRPEEFVSFFNCPSLANCCQLYTPVTAAMFSDFYNCPCDAAAIRAYGPCDAINLHVDLQFKDQAGNAVGDVHAVLTVPGGKDWKMNSAYQWQFFNGEPWNARFKGRLPCFDGPLQFDFTAPEGWRFAGPDFLTVERAGCEDYYATSGHIFILERIDGSTTAPAPPIEPACPPESTAPFALAFLKGSPSWPSENWCNAVDGDFWGWDGTATVQPDESGFAWAIFKFADDQTALVRQVGMHVINLEMDDIFERWTSEFEVLVSTTGVDPQNFTSIGKFKMNDYPFLRWFNIQNPANATYVMLKILQPAWSPRNFKQVVEFCVNDCAPMGMPDFNDFPSSRQTEIAALPQKTGLVGNYPNPFNPVTTISFHLAESAPVKLTVCTMTGQTVATLVDETREAGSHRVSWNAAGQPSGVYLCRFQAGAVQQTQRLLLVK